MDKLREPGNAVIYDNPAAVRESPKPQAASFKPGAFPNPFRGSTTIRFGSVRENGGGVTIVDAAGRCVRVLDVGRNSSGVAWDGRNDSGQRVPAGVYFVRLGSPSARAAARVVVVE